MNRQKSPLWVLASGLAAGASSGALADQFHANNFLLGARAQGMGGAFAAIGDDASGVFYNPGATAFARGSDLSVSAATFYQRQTTYARVYGEQAFTEKARGAVSTFLGGLTRVGAPTPLGGVTFGFALYSPDAGLVDQNTIVFSVPEANLLRYHRMQSQRSNSLHAAGSVALGIGKVLGLGVSAGYFDVDELVLTAQEVEQGPYAFPDYAITAARSVTSVQTRESLRLAGIEASIGARVELTQWLSLGGALRMSRVLRQDLRRDREEQSAWLGPDDKPVVSAKGGDARFEGKVRRKTFVESDDAVFGRWPAEARIGLALHPWAPFTWSFDAAHRTAGPSRQPGYARAAVTDVHTGLELVWLSRLVTRGGAFTNFDATASRDPLSEDSRGEHVDYLGATGALSIRFKKSEYGASYVHQWGKGKAEKSPGTESAVTSRIQLLTVSASQAL